MYSVILCRRREKKSASFLLLLLTTTNNDEVIIRTNTKGKIASIAIGTQPECLNCSGSRPTL